MEGRGLGQGVHRFRKRGIGRLTTCTIAPRTASTLGRRELIRVALSLARRQRRRCLIVTVIVAQHSFIVMVIVSRQGFILTAFVMRHHHRFIVMMVIFNRRRLLVMVIVSRHRLLMAALRGDGTGRLRLGLLPSGHRMRGRQSS